MNQYSQCPNKNYSIPSQHPWLCKNKTHKHDRSRAGGNLIFAMCNASMFNVQCVNVQWVNVQASFLRRRESCIYSTFDLKDVRITQRKCNITNHQSPFTNHHSPIHQFIFIQFPLEYRLPRLNRLALLLQILLFLLCRK